MGKRKAARIVRRHPRVLRVDDEIVIRILAKRDAASIFALVDRNREYLRRWLPWVDDTRSSAATLKFVEDGAKQLRRDDGFQAGIWYCGELVGIVGYHYWDKRDRKTELGYWLAEPAQGKGIMTRAVRALVDYAFDGVGLNRVEIRAAVGNARSRAVPERLGFRQEGLLREADYAEDRLQDQVVYGLLRKDRGGGSL